MWKMAEDENKAEPSEFRPTLTDALYSSLNLPEKDGQAAVVLFLLEEILTVLVKSNALSGEELDGMLDKVGERVRGASVHAKQEVDEARKEKGYPQSYLDEIMDRITNSAHGILSSIRKRVINKSDQ
jgi:hypothetical protein